MVIITCVRVPSKTQRLCFAFLTDHNLAPLSALPTYPVVIINWVQYLGPPGPFSFPDSRDLLEVLGDFLGRERGGSLGDPPGP